MSAEIVGSSIQPHRVYAMVSLKAAIMALEKRDTRDARGWIRAALKQIDHAVRSGLSPEEERQEVEREQRRLERIWARASRNHRKTKAKAT